MINRFFCLLAFAVVLGLFSGCKESPVDPGDDPLIRTWVFTDFNQEHGTEQYISLPNLKNDAPGYVFRTDGSLTVRQNSGWCGNSPVNYENYKGTWHFESDAVLWISTQYWGTYEDKGNLVYRFEIVELDFHRMVVKRVE